VCRKNKELLARDIPLTTYIILKIPTVGMCKNKFQTWCSNFTMMQRLMILRSSFCWDRFGCMREKKRVLGEEKEKLKFRGRESVEMYRQCENWPSMSLFITRLFRAYFLLYFPLFYPFIKRNSILLPIKWINKTFLLKIYIYFIYLKTIILINKIISPYVFHYKNFIIFLKLYLFLNKILLNLFLKKWGVTNTESSNFRN